MLRLEKVDESNRRRVVELLSSDVIRHAFAIYDLQYKPEYTTMYLALDEGKMEGYILIYTGLGFPSVVLECRKGLADKLLDYAPRGRFILHAPIDSIPVVRDRFPEANYYLEEWMVVRRGEERTFKSELVRRLSTRDDADQLAHLVQLRRSVVVRDVERYMEQITDRPTYGVFLDGRLISYASVLIQLPQVWVIGGVYTHPDYRNRGYGTLVTSAVTEEALKNAGCAALFVRTDNYPAIRVYSKIGYKRFGEKVWVDVGLGMKP